MIRRIAGLEGWQRLLNSKSAQWQSNIERFSEPLVSVSHEPRFRLSADDVFFCLGSCFARNVEEHLVYSGRRVLSKGIICPATEWPGARIGGFVNKFTTASILNELQWVIDPPVNDERLFEETQRGWLDLQLAPGIRPVTLERAMERRAYLTDEYFSRLRQSTVVIVTLGLIETWHDKKSGRYLNAAPSFYSVRNDPDRYSVEITDVDSNVRALEAILECLRRLQPAAKIILTVSPVPMDSTFAGRDVVTANMLSKSTLRVAAETFANEHAVVDYFPSFDMIAMSPRASAYGADCLHVSERAVGSVVARFLELYTGEPIAATQFNEIAYLAANPDVEGAVRSGQWESGFAHWLRFGQKEGRRITPEGGPTDLMIAAGAV
jgi:hypothetical protein